MSNTTLNINNLFSNMCFLPHFCAGEVQNHIIPLILHL